MMSSQTITRRFDGLFKSIALSAGERGTDAQAADMPWLPGCAKFLRHWDGLRHGAPMPATEDFIDNPSPEFAPSVYILELLGESALVRLQGTALETRWHRRLTGQDFFAGRSDRFAASGTINMRTLFAHPCGLLARTTYATTRGRQITSDWIQVPLAVQSGRPPRIVGAVFQSDSDDQDYTETPITYFKAHKVEWLDTGSGVPAVPPVEFQPQ